VKIAFFMADENASHMPSVKLRHDGVAVLRFLTRAGHIVASPLNSRTVLPQGRRNPYARRIARAGRGAHERAGEPARSSLTCIVR
jgi:hypothetical protein